MFSESAHLYDAIYRAFKDYAAEATSIATLVRGAHPTATTILDVGCGTGEHALHLLEIGEVLDRRRACGHQSNPFSAIEKLCPGLTMMWSSTRTSTSASAARSVCVSDSSAREGSMLPLGWLCASTIAAS